MGISEQAVFFAEVTSDVILNLHTFVSVTLVLGLAQGAAALALESGRDGWTYVMLWMTSGINDFIDTAREHII